MRLSIHARILLSAFIILALFLSLTGIVLDKAFRNNVENAQKENLRTQVYTLLATAELGDDEQLSLPEEITEPRLNIAESTLHARVVTPQQEVIWQSKSMLNTQIPYPAKIKLGEFVFTINTNSNKTYTILSFATLWVTEKGEQQYVFQVAENQQVFEQQVNIFRQNLWGWLAGVGLLLIIVQAFILRWGLTPLRHVADDLIAIEQGKTRRLSGDYPKEITPLTNNLNQLLESSQQQLTRYRDALGNMAHSLKTPIAVLRGIFSASNMEQKDTAEEQIQTINNIVEYQLQRAATAGQRGTHTQTLLQPVVEKINNSLQKVFHDKQVNITINIEPELSLKMDEGDLFELLGNLFENAYKWCNKTIHFSASSLNQNIELIIEDDGPGIEEEQRERILLRGQRADQNTPGHGLGMAMINDMLLLYKGSMEITDSSLGGAQITIRL